MSVIHNLRIKFYYLIVNSIQIKERIDLVDKYNAKKNFFLYFDYEREFGGHNTNITDQDITTILNLLDKYKIKTTWFTVGKIFSTYPESIQLLLEKGHEIGSHTYNHIAPINQKKTQLNKDFKEFLSETPRNISISGFHSPNGLWSYALFELLDKYNFKYDLIACKKKYRCFSHTVKYSLKKERTRFVTLGDDWPMYNKNNTIQQVFTYFKDLSEHILPGQIAGIGFHPWILFSDKQILEGFILFLEYISDSKNIYTDTIENYFNHLTSK